MAHDVFISYSSKDKPTADAACALLEGLGVRCWVAPRDVAPGSDWSEAIVDAIAASRVMVLIFSDNANRSPQVRREVERAVHHEVTLVPFRIENVPPCKSLEYFISVPHWMDAWTEPLEQHLNQLGERVSAILRPGGEGSRESPVHGAGRAARDRAARARRYKALWRVSLVGLKLAAIVAAFVFFFGRIPFHVHWAAAEDVRPVPPELPAAPVLPVPEPVRPSPGLRAPEISTRSAFLEAQAAEAAHAREASEARATEARAAREAEAARRAQAIQAAQVAAQSLRLTSVAVIGRERFCVIDGVPLREGDSFRDFVVQEIRSDEVVLAREGTAFRARLQPRPPE